MGYFVRAKRLEAPVWDSSTKMMHYAQGHSDYQEWKDFKFEISDKLDKRGRVAAFSKVSMIALDNDGNPLPCDEEGNPKWPGIPAPKFEAKLVTPAPMAAVPFVSPSAQQVEPPGAPPKRRMGRPRKIQEDQAAT